jgi:pimeloyl-ACP methyl ester carboxylesterase
MATFVLVHGAWHGAWCWDKVAPILKGRGHTVAAPDLPGHGDDATPRGSVTLDSYGARVAETVSSQKEKVILVGHSMGGIAITAGAERVPDRIAKAVYLTAFLPRNGESLMALEDRNPRKSVPLALVIEDGSPTATLDPAKIGGLFFHDCSPADAAAATARLTPQPLAPFGTPLAVTAENFGRVPKAYIECTDDRAISIELQRDMLGKTPVVAVKSLPASHSPFLSMPDRLADALQSLI